MLGPVLRRDSNTFILSVFSLRIVIELPVQVSACVETKAASITLRFLCGAWRIVQGLPKQNLDVGFYFIHCSIFRRLKLAFEVKEKRKVRKGRRSQGWVLDLFRIPESGCWERQCGRSENRQQSGILYKRDGKAIGQYIWRRELKQSERKVKRGWAVLRLSWDWNSTEDWHHHCDSACFGAGPVQRCTAGSISRDEGKRCVKEHKITVLPGAWKGRGEIKYSSAVQTMK